MRFRYVAALFLLLLGACKINHVANIESNSYRIDTNMQPAASIAPSSPNPATAGSAANTTNDLISPYRSQLEAEMNEVVGTTTKVMEKGSPESLLGNWMSDVLAEQTAKVTGKPVDFAVVNYGGIRIPSMPKGEITKGKIFELMPFDNLQVVVLLDATTVQQFADHMAQKGGWPISEGLRFVIQDEKAVDVTVGGKALDPNKTYRVSVSDYVANGGSACAFLKGKPVEETGEYVRDLIIANAKATTAKGLPLDATLDQRTQIK